MHIIVHPTGRNSSEFSVPLKLRRAYTVLQIIQCPGSTPAEAPGVSKKIRTCTVNSLYGRRIVPRGGAGAARTRTSLASCRWKWQWHLLLHGMLCYFACSRAHVQTKRWWSRTRCAQCNIRSMPQADSSPFGCRRRSREASAAPTCLECLFPLSPLGTSKGN